MAIIHIELKRPEDRRLLFENEGSHSSAPFDWEPLYFEHREADAFETCEHTLEGHYLMVKLNAMSKAIRRIEGKAILEKQRRGSMTYVPHGHSHSVRYLTSLGSLNLMTISKPVIDEVADELGIANFEGIPRLADNEDRFVLEAALSIENELAKGNPHGPLYAQVYARMLAAHIITHYRDTKTVFKHPSVLSNAKIRWLDQFIESMIAHPISLSQLAEQAGLSQYYFCRLFKNTTGLSPYKYIMHKRIEFATTCLKTDNLSMLDISFAAGFNDAAQFSKQFRLITGMTPSAFRQKYRRKCNSN